MGCSGPVSTWVQPQKFAKKTLMDGSETAENAKFSPSKVFHYTYVCTCACFYFYLFYLILFYFYVFKKKKIFFLFLYILNIMHYFVFTAQLLTEHASMETFVWLMDVIRAKGVWRCVSTTTGAPSAMMAGIRTTQMWCVLRWATLQMVSPSVDIRTSKKG